MAVPQTLYDAMGCQDIIIPCYLRYPYIRCHITVRTSFWDFAFHDLQLPLWRCLRPLMWFVAVFLWLLHEIPHWVEASIHTLNVKWFVGIVVNNFTHRTCTAFSIHLSAAFHQQVRRSVSNKDNNTIRWFCANETKEFNVVPILVGAMLDLFLLMLYEWNENVCWPLRCYPGGV